MILFELTGLATISHINIRRAGDDVSVDIKFGISDAPASAAAAALGAESALQVTDALFYPAHEDAEQPARFLACGGINCAAEWRSRHTLKLGHLRPVRLHKVGKVVLVPRAAGLFDATFSAAIESPPPGYIEALSAMLQDAVRLELTQDPELDL